LRRRRLFWLQLSFCLLIRCLTHEPLHSAWRNFAWTCTLTTSRSLLNFKVKGQRSWSHTLLVCMIWWYLQAVLCRERKFSLIWNKLSSLVTRTFSEYEFFLQKQAGRRRGLRLLAIAVMRTDWRVETHSQGKQRRCLTTRVAYSNTRHWVKASFGKTVIEGHVSRKRLSQKEQFFATHVTSGLGIIRDHDQWWTYDCVCLARLCR